MAKGKNKLNKTNSSGWLDDYSEEFAIETYPDGGIIDTIKSFFTEKTDNKSSKSTPTKSSPKTFKIEDKRKVLATSGQPIRPNVDITSGEYDLDVLKGIIESAKRNNLPIEDAKNLAAIAFQESKFGKTDKNIGHVINNLQSRSDLEALTNTYINKMKKADKLGLTDEALRLQVYNGLGVIKPSTEQDYHGFKMKKIYGVPVPNEGISMKKNPLYGKQIMDLRDNVLNQNPEYIKYINNIYNSNSPAPVYSDIELKSWGPFPHLMKFEMGGDVEIPIMKDGGQHGGLDRWFAEKWVDVKTGKECGRQKGEKRKGYPACRPSKRISSETPKTASELSAAEKAKFKREKTSSERIDYIHKKEDGGLIYNDMKKTKKYPAGGYLNYQEGFKGFGVGPELYQDNSYFRSVMPDNIENMEATINQPSVFSGINDILGSVNQGVNQITGLMNKFPQPLRQLTEDKMGGTEGVTTLQGMTKINEDLVAPEYSANMWEQKSPLFTAPQFKNGGNLNKYQNGGEMDMLPVGSPEYIHKSNVFHENYNPVPRVHFSDDTSVFDIGVNLNDLVNMNGGRINQYANGGDMSLQGYFNYLQNQSQNRVPSRAFNANTNRATAEQLQAANANDFLSTKVRKDRQSFEDDKVDWGFMNFAKQPVGAYLGMMSNVPIIGDVTKDIVGDSFLTRTEGYQVGQGVGKTTFGAGKIAGGVALTAAGMPQQGISMIGQGVGDVGSGVGSTVGNLNARSAMEDYNKEGYISGKRLEKSSQDFGDMMYGASDLFSNIQGGIGKAKNMGNMKGFNFSQLAGIMQDGGYLDMYQEGGMVSFPEEFEIPKYKKGGLTPKKAREILHDKSVHGNPLTDKQRKYFGYISSQKKSSGGWMDSL